MGGIGPKEPAQRGQQRRSGRRGQLDRGVAAVGGGALQQADDGGGGVGQEPVGGAHGAGPQGHRRGGDPVHAEHLQGRRRADHVDHGVVPADLVEVHLLGVRGGGSAPPPRPARRTRPAPGGPPARAVGPRPPARRCRRGSATTTSSWTDTTARVQAMPPRRTASCRRSQPASGTRRRMASTSSRSAPASSRLPSAMSPAMPAKQWNQATVDGPPAAAAGPPGSWRTVRRSRQQARHGAGGAEAVVDADDGHARGAGGRMASRAVTPSSAAP